MSLFYYSVEVYSVDAKGKISAALVSINASIPQSAYEKELLKHPSFQGHTIQVLERIDKTYYANPEAVEII